MKITVVERISVADSGGSTSLTLQDKIEAVCDLNLNAGYQLRAMTTVADGSELLLVFQQAPA